MRLIDADALKEELEISKYIIPNCLNTLLNLEIYRCIEAIDNAPTVCGNNPLWCESCVSKGKCQATRPQGECEKCDYRKVAERFVDGIVDFMNKNDITSFEQLSEILKGGAEMLGGES